MRIYLLPHQDDEFAMLQSMVDQLDRDIALIFMTNGWQPGGPAPEVRNAESMRVLASMGIPAEKAYFLGTHHDFGDGFMPDNIKATWEALLTHVDLLLRDSGGSLTSVYMPAWEGGHQDHDVTHVLGVCLAIRHDCLDSSRQISLYHGCRMPWKFYRVLQPLAENGAVEPVRIPWANRLKILALFRHYRSQWKSIIGLYPFVLLRMLIRGEECYQRVSYDRLQQSPHTGRLFYESRGFANENVVRESISRFLAGLR